jgi:hypothetical protein
MPTPGAINVGTCFMASPTKVGEKERPRGPDATGFSPIVDSYAFCVVRPDVSWTT